MSKPIKVITLREPSRPRGFVANPDEFVYADRDCKVFLQQVEALKGYYRSFSCIRKYYYPNNITIVIKTRLI